MTDINNKVSINVNKDQGLISAIKTKLGAENINTSNITWNVWTKILEQVKNENEQNKTEGKELIYHKGSNASGSGKDNFVVFQGVIKFSQTLWNNICKLAKGEPLNESPTANPNQTGNVEGNPNDIALQNRTNTLKAINVIQSNIAKLELPPNVDKSKINEVMAELSKNGLTLPQQSVSVGDMTTSLLVDLLTKLMPNASEEEINYYAIKNASNFVPDDTIGGRKCSELANNDDLIRGMTKGEVVEIVPTPPTQEVQAPQQVPLEQLKANVEKAVTILKAELKNFTEDDLCDLAMTDSDREKILSFLDNITYDDDPTGAAKAVNNGIVFSTYCQKSDNVANVVALLMHEANHCIRHSQWGMERLNSKEEEWACESLAMLTVAKLIEKGKLQGYENYQRYSVPVTEYLKNRELLSTDMNDWLTRNYSELPNYAAYNYIENRWEARENPRE